MSQFAQHLSTFKIFTKSCKSVHKFVFNALVLPSWLSAKFPYETDIGGGGGVYIECGVMFHYFEITSARQTPEVDWVLVVVEGGEKETDISMLLD